MLVLVLVPVQVRQVRGYGDAGKSNATLTRPQGLHVMSMRKKAMVVTSSALVPVPVPVLLLVLLVILSVGVVA